MNALVTKLFGSLLSVVLVSPLLADSMQDRQQWVQEGYASQILPPAELTRLATPSANETVYRHALHSDTETPNYLYDVEWFSSGDADEDGYSHRLRLRIDADSYSLRPQEVFVRVYLSQSGLDWTLLHESDWFSIELDSLWDSYEIDIELKQGYQPAQYDILVELYDDYSAWPADSLILGDSLNGYGVALEDSDYDTPRIRTHYTVDYVVSEPYYDDVSISVGATGSTTLGSLALLGLMGLWRRGND